jgi:hypothetical protein
MIHSYTMVAFHRVFKLWHCSNWRSCFLTPAVNEGNGLTDSLLVEDI